MSDVRKMEQMAAEQTEDQIFNWAVRGMLNRNSLNNKVHAGTVGLYWLDFMDSKILELDLAGYTGNGSGLSFAYWIEDLEREIETGKPFQLPFEQLKPVEGAAFALEGLPGEVSFLPGMLYSRRKLKPERRTHNLDDLGFLIGGKEASCYLVRILIDDATFNRLLAEDDERLMGLLTREDLMMQRWIENRTGLWNEAEIYLVINAAESRELGLLREELLA